MSTAASTLATRADIQRRLRRAWRRERRFHHARGLCHVVLWLVALVCLDLLVDWLFLLPGPGRVALLAVNAGALGWVAWTRWARHLERFDPVRGALQVERRHPELCSLLVSYVQLREEAAPPHTSRAMIRAVRREAMERSRPIDFREIVRFAELRRIALFSLVVLAAFGAFSVNWSGHLRVLARRLLHPQADIEYPTRTQIVAVTGDVTVQQGQPVVLSAEAAGDVPARGTLHVKPGEAPWESLPLPQGKPGRFAYRFAEVLDSFRYRIALGDDRSDEHRVTVVPPPRLVQRRVALRYPSYTGRSPETVDRLNLEVPEGTEIAWTLTSDAPLAAAHLTVDDGPPQPLSLDPTGRTLRHRTLATASFSYSFTWHELAHGYVYPDDVRYFVHVVPDLPPSVELLFPTEDAKATVRKTLTVRFHKADDYAVAQGWIVATLADGHETRVPLPDLGPAPGEHEATWTLRETLPALQVGDVLTVAIEVADGYTGPDGPHRSRSQARRLSIVSIEEYRRYIREKRRKLRAELEALRGQEQEAATAVDTLIAEPEEEGQPPEKER